MKFRATVVFEFNAHDVAEADVTERPPGAGERAGRAWRRNRSSSRRDRSRRCRCRL
jgi:hypothetical protein